METQMHAKITGYLGALTLLAIAPAADRVAAQEPSEQDGSPHYSFYNLGTFGGSSSSGNAINSLGWVMGNANLPGDGATHAAVWIDGMKFDLGTLGGLNSGVEWPVHNDRGVIAGIAETAAIDQLKENWSCSAFFPTIDHHVCVGFRWLEGVMTPLPTLGGTNGYASGVNQHGQVVGWAETTLHDTTCTFPQVLQFEAVLWSPDGKVQELPPLPGDVDGAATAINENGDAVGISGTCNNAVGAATAKNAVIWRNGVPALIKTFGGQGWNTPTDINAQGLVVGFADVAGDVVDGVLTPFPLPIAFIWSEVTGTEEIQPLPGDKHSIAYSINDYGQVVGQSYGGPEGSRAFIWQNGKSYDLNGFLPAGSSLYLVYAEGINNRGEITGGACVAADGVCATPAVTPAFLAIPNRGDEKSGEASAAAPSLENAAANGTAPLVTVPRDLYQATLRRWGYPNLRP
jgi:probable HAF family extracellular repeat protein